MILIKVRTFESNSKFCQVILVKKTSHWFKVLPLLLSLKQSYWGIMMPGSPKIFQGKKNKNKTVFKCNSIC